MIGHRSLNLEDYLSILKRRWWILAIPAVILPIIAYALSYTVQPQYMSRTLVLIDSQKIPEGYVKPVVTSNLDSRLGSMKEQIFSRTSLEPIINRYNLYPDAHLTMEERLDKARKNIDIKLINSEIAHSGGLPGFFISFTAGDPHVAQMVCGEIESLFVGENLRSREASAQGTTSFIRSQLDEAKRSLDEQDAKLAAFQRENAGKLPDQTGSNVNMLSSLNTQLEAANQALGRMEQDKTYAESMLAQASSQTTTNNGITTPANTAPSPQQLELQALISQEADLSAHYTADYPDVIAVRRKIADLKRQIAKASSPNSSGGAARASESPAVAQLRAVVKAAEIGIAAKRKEQAAIQAQIGTYQSRIQSTPVVEQQYKQLTRDYTQAQAFYDDLLAKMNQSKMATELEKQQEGEQFRVMDEPNLPDQPISPKRSVFLMGGIVGGLVFGLLIVGFLEYKDTTMRSERDVWAFTQLPTLAKIAFTEPEQPKTGKRFRLRLPSFGKKDKLKGKDKEKNALVEANV